MDDLRERCPGPLIWYDADASGILECASPDCDYLIVTGNFNDPAHAETPTMREGLAA